MNKKFEDVIAEQGRLVYTNVGDSMFPIIREGDLLVINAVTEPLKVGDVPLYKRDSGQYIMHRIVALKNGKYTMKGDNRAIAEKGITARHIIGVLTGIVRNGRTYPVETVEEYTIRIAKELIYLLSCAVNEETPDPDRVKGMDMAEIYRLSREHMLTAAVSYALEKAIPLPYAFNQAQKKAIRKLTLFEIERAAITQELEKAGIWYLPLKGIMLKNDYPKSAMREMSDNDILVDNTKMPEVRQIMESLGYTCEMYGRFNHDVYSKPPTLEFEMHHSLFDKDVLPHQDRYYKHIREKLLPLPGSEYGLKMTDEDFYLYILCHLYKHYTHAGSGLRSLLDIYVFRRAHPNLDREYLDAELQKLKIADFERKIRRMSQSLFTVGEPDEEDQKDFVYLIMSGYKGKFETLEHNQLVKNLNNDDSKASKLRYLKKRFFLSGDSLQKQYPFFAKHKALYPLLLIYRPLKGAVTHPKGILRELYRVKSFKKEG